MSAVASGVAPATSPGYTDELVTVAATVDVGLLGPGVVSAVFGLGRCPNTANMAFRGGGSMGSGRAAPGRRLGPILLVDPPPFLSPVPVVVVPAVDFAAALYPSFSGAGAVE